MEHELQSTTRYGKPHLPFHVQASAVVAAPVERVFSHIDDHARLASHMSQSSWRMGGGRMQLDDAHGQNVGSRLRLAGHAFGLALAVEEEITERLPPWRKSWQTIGTPRLLVIGHYHMGFELSRSGNDSRLQVFIDYALPAGGIAGWLMRPLASLYARWCVRSMLQDTVQAFAAARHAISQGDAS